MAQNIFICYADTDRPAAELICAGVEAAGIGCWIAPRDMSPKESPAESLKKGIAQARVVLLVVSKNANVSESVEREMELAVATDTTPCPVRIEDVLLSDPLTLLVGTVQWFDAIAPPLEQHIDAIAAALKAFLSRPPPLTREPSDRPLSLDSAVRWDLSTLDRQRAEQGNAIAAWIQHFHAREREFVRLRALVDDQIRYRKFRAANETIAQLDRLKPWDPATATMRRFIAQQPAGTSLLAVASLLVSGLSICVGPMLFGAVQGVRGGSDDISLTKASYLVWMIAALVGAGLGIWALVSIKRSPVKMRGLRRAGIGTGLGFLMALFALLALAGMSMTPTH